MAIRVEPLRGHLARLPVAAIRPWHLLAGLVVVQWACVLAFALTVRHNGWLYYQGGDQIYHYSSAWLLAHGTLPPALIAYQWPAMVAPLAAVAGPSFVSALPVMIVVNVVILLPVALLAVYGIATRIGGRGLGLFAAVLWVVFPWLGVAYANPGYHQKFTEEFLPQALGLTAMVDFPATVALAVAAFFCVRALETRNLADGALSGLTAGIAIGLKASNFLFLPFPLLALLAARRWRQAAALAVGVTPSLVVLALWKERGLGHVPAFSAPAAQVALGAAGVAVGGVLTPLHKYVHLNWGHLYDNVLGIKEHFWSVRLVQWVPLAGLIALLRRSIPLVLLVGGWFCAYFFVKGSYSYSNVEDGSFFRFLMPAYPAFLLLCATVVLLAPGALPRLQPTRVRELSERTSIASVTIAVLLFAIAPLAAVAAADPLRSSSPRAVTYIENLTPVTSRFDLRVQRRAGGSRLTWSSPAADRAAVFYVVFRSRRVDDTSCAAPGGAATCALQAAPIATTRRKTFVDPTRGRWTYRVGVAANWLNDTSHGDVFLLSTPTRA
jgi:hypothetical protein